MEFLDGSRIPLDFSFIRKHPLSCISFICQDSLPNEANAGSQNLDSNYLGVQLSFFTCIVTWLTRRVMNPIIISPHTGF